MSARVDEFLKKLRGQPENVKKIVLWSTVVLVGLTLFIFWLNSTKARLRNFQKDNILKDIGVPNLKKEIENIPPIEFPEIKVPELSEDELKAFEEAMKEAEEQGAPLNP